jgi:molybdate transport system ATP-binding protein
MMRDPAPFLSIEDVSLYLHEGTTSAPIRWEIQSDQHWAVIGPNGSGKSRLIKAVVGQAPVAAGVIAYHFANNGRSPRDCVAYVSFESQSAGLPFESPFHQARWNRGVGQRSLSVCEFLSEQRVKQINPFQVVDDQTDRDDFRAYQARIIELLGIEGLLGRSMDQVSNGERRKVLLARALLKRPRLLILDNPFVGLDAGFRDRLRQILSTLMEEELRVVVVMSGREPVPEGITHVLLMDQGKVVAQGPKEEMLCALPADEGSDPDEPEAFPLSVVGTARHGLTRTGFLVQMRNVSVSYGSVQILDGVDWLVRAGENWALVGPNGAGKTTLLSLILGDNPQAYANDVSLFGKRRGSGETIWDVKKRIGWVAPELHLYYPKNVPCIEVVCSGFHDTTGPYRRCSSQQREAACGWLRRLGMQRVGDMAFGAVSEGEQRLVLIARALVKGPELLILDEPCQGLDAANRDGVLRMVEAVGDHTASSLIYVSHQRDALPGIITHMLRLEAGRVVSRGRVQDMDVSLGRKGRAEHMFEPAEPNVREPA